MTYNELLENARRNMAPKCRVCKECNGIACRGELPGVGGYGNGQGFHICLEYLKKIKINMDTIYEAGEVDTSADLLGRRLSLPVMISPIGGMAFNYNGYMTDVEYNTRILNGASQENLIAFSGDTPDDNFFNSLLPLIEKSQGQMISTIKPWENKYIIEKASKLKEAGAKRFAIDIDSAGLPALCKNGKTGGFPKSIADIEYLIRETGMNVILKGVMTAEGALKAKAAGAEAIIVSSHGGRHYQDAPATASLLPEIREAVGPDYPVFVDGGIRSGADVFKVLALGADAAMIGRPYAIAAHGDKDRGVSLYTQKLRDELLYTMKLAGAKTIKDINAHMIRIEV